MTAILVAQEFSDDVRIAVSGIRELFGQPDVLHWKKHCRTTKRRDIVTRTLARIPRLKTIHIVLDKTRLQPGSYTSKDPGATYHWVTKFLIERIAQSAENWPGGPRTAILKMGDVGGVDHEETKRVLERIIKVSGRKSAHPIVRAINWDSIIWPPQWTDTSDQDGIQAADAYSGMLSAAVKDDVGKWLVETRHQIFRRSEEFEGYGIKTLPDRGHLQDRDWWSRL